MNLDDPVSPGEKRRAAVHHERVEAIEGLREQIKTLEEREPALRQEISEFERSQRATIAELERNQRTTLAELERNQRARLGELERALRTNPENAEELEDELAGIRLGEELRRTRTELDDELERTRTELDEELAGMRAELAAIGPALIEARCTLGMKMSDSALEEHEGDEQAIEYLQPLLVELGGAYRRASAEARRKADEAEEKLAMLHEEHHETADAALPVVEERFQPLIDAEIIAVTIEQAKARVARHRLALVDPEDGDPDGPNPRLAHELALEAALDALDAARAKVSALQEEKRAAVYHYTHPTAEKSKRLGKQLAKRFGRRH